MNEQGELPPPYEEFPVETTPLLPKYPHDKPKRRRPVAALALLVTGLVVGFVFLYSVNSATKEESPKAPVRIAVIGENIFSLFCLCL
jgi:NADH:ubiquinone oxidoreductase subunit 6 (subunit J)